MASGFSGSTRASAAAAHTRTKLTESRNASVSAGTASRAVRPISASACAARRRSSGSLLFSAATQSAVATPRYDGRPNMRSLRGLANRISFTTIGDEGRLPINPLRTNQESLHNRHFTAGAAFGKTFEILAAGIHQCDHDGSEEF